VLDSLDSFLLYTSTVLHLMSRLFTTRVVSDRLVGKVNDGERERVREEEKQGQLGQCNWITVLFLLQ